MADDLIDNAETTSDQGKWLEKLQRFLDLSYDDRQKSPKDAKIQKYIQEQFPRSTWSALSLLPTEKLQRQPLNQLLEGFQTDVDADHDKELEFPIRDENALDRYSACVASTVGELCMCLIFSHVEQTRGYQISKSEKSRLHKAAWTMGIALQCVNIARDIQVDAEIGRVYIPTTWLKEEGLAPRDVLEHPQGSAIQRLRTRLLDKAFGLYREARPTMDHIPKEARAPMIAAVESYMEIGRVIRERKDSTVKSGKATVPRIRRAWVLFRSLLRSS